MEKRNRPVIFTFLVPSSLSDEIIVEHVNSKKIINALQKISYNINGI